MLPVTDLLGAEESCLPGVTVPQAGLRDVGRGILAHFSWPQALPPHARACHPTGLRDRTFSLATV